MEQLFNRILHLYRMPWFVACLFVSSSLFGQMLEKSFSIRHEEGISAISIDKKGAVFVATQRGSIYKYEGNARTLHFSSEQQLAFDAIEARQSLRILAFNKPMQQVLVLDRFLANHQLIQLDDLEDAGLISAVTIAQNGQLLLFDQQQMQLIYLNASNGRIVSLMPLQSLPYSNKLDAIGLLSVGRRVLLRIRDELLEFDNFGNFKGAYQLEGAAPVFLWEELVYTLDKNGKPYVFDLKQASSVDLALQLEKPARALLRNDDYLIAMTDDEIVYFKLL
jgi:hypothetical protein